ncbi:unnamed protein product [Acanthoscelides obtectus]|uniref:Integrase catalytic domain-containing protein n=2 Tax=Acanthoscelides obtectus TaxID=200917 RepID=A0A9P0MGF7_ACAOB|nr:unnamed protein product [Acanthoscelides obtectus]CAK1682286.1 Retrovirus-related Pol polyprotein from transposon 412 [Acanthoscelides obtectus]
MGIVSEATFRHVFHHDFNLHFHTPAKDTVCHPQSNGSIERFHATLLEMIRSHVSESPDEHPFNILPYAVQCYNSTRNKTTGFTPYELVFGHTSGRPPEHVYLEKELMSNVSHPQSNGSIGRFHATLLEMIRSHVSENPDEHPFNILPYAVQCYNSTRNKTTGFTPYELVFGHTSGRPPEHVYLEKELMSKYVRDIRNKLEYYYKIARVRTDEQKQKAKIRFDSRVSPNLQSYKIGDKVFVKQSQISNKLQNKFDGPFEITQVFENSALLKNPETNRISKVNFDRLKPCFET